jgi:hypothetical protein
MDISNNDSNTLLVTEKIQQFEEAFVDKIQIVRNIIMMADPNIREKIEWNFPCFYIGDVVASTDFVERDKVLIEMNLRHKKIILVFPSGTIVKGVTGIYEGSYKDGRRIVPMGDLEDIAEKAPLLTAVVQKWIAAATSKKAK